jgi:Flp pilus assembly protein TadG
VTGPPACPATWGRRHRRGDAGSAAVELTLLAPLLILLLLFVVACGRLVQTRLRLDDAAHAAARSASLARDAAAAVRTANTTARAALSPTGATCSAVTVTTDTSHFIPGGQVRVTVTCRTDLADLSGLRLPGSTTQTVSFTSAIDTFRSVATAGTP